MKQQCILTYTFLLYVLYLTISGAAYGQKNRIGVQIKETPADEQIDIARELHTIYSRAPGVETSNFNPNNKEFKPFWERGQRFDIALNQYPTSDKGKPFAKNQKELNEWAAQVIKVMKAFDPKLPVNVSIINEELNQNYHSGPMSDYLKMLDTAVKICHNYGCRATNGGMPEQVICQVVYRWYKFTLNDNKRANDWADQTMDDGAIKSANNYQEGSNIRRCDTLLDAYKDMDLDYINIHLYYPWDKDKGGKNPPNVIIPEDAFKQIADVIYARTGKHCVSNETSIRHSNRDLLHNFLGAYSMGGWQYISFISSFGGSAGEISLIDEDGNLNDMGKAYRDFVDEYYNGPLITASAQVYSFKPLFILFLVLFILALIYIIYEHGKKTTKKI